MMRNTTSRFLCLALTLLLFAPLAIAAEGGDDLGERSIFEGDLGNIVWTLVVFLLVVFVLGKFAWGPILEGLQKREDFIHSALAEAKSDRDEAKATLAQYENKIAEARGEATDIVEEGRRDAEVVRQRIEDKARDEAEKMIERAKREIGIAQETAIKDLYQVSGQLATGIAAKIVDRELRPEDHQRLIHEALDQMAASADARNSTH